MTDKNTRVYELSAVRMIKTLAAMLRGGQRKHVMLKAEKSELTFVSRNGPGTNVLYFKLDDQVYSETGFARPQCFIIRTRDLVSFANRRESEARMILSITTGAKPTMTLQTSEPGAKPVTFGIQNDETHGQFLRAANIIKTAEANFKENKSGLPSVIRKDLLREVTNAGKIEATVTLSPVGDEILIGTAGSAGGYVGHVKAYNVGEHTETGFYSVVMLRDMLRAWPDRHVTLRMADHRPLILKLTNNIQYYIGLAPFP